MFSVTWVVRAWAVEVLDFAVFDRVLDLVDLVDLRSAMVIMGVSLFAPCLRRGLALGGDRFLVKERAIASTKNFYLACPEPLAVPRDLLLRV